MARISTWLLVVGLASLTVLSACGDGDDGAAGDGDSGDGDATGTGGQGDLGDGDGDTSGGDGDGDTSGGDGDGDTSGTGGSGQPQESCATCTSGEFCIEVTGHFGNPFEEICVALPSGCELEMLCDCGIELIEGVAINGCINTNPPYHHAEGISCGAAPCGAGQICLYDEGTGAAECVATTKECPVDESFCSGNCDDAVAGQHGKTATWCDEAAGFVGVGYDSTE